MTGTLAAQAEMIWPHEQPLLERLGLPAAGRVLDLGCGTGRISGRMAAAWPGLDVTGFDLYEGHLAVARRDHPPSRFPRLRFLAGDARRTGLPSASFGAVVIRHMLHALPDPQAVLVEAARLLVPGGLLYELAEDYQGLLIDSPDRGTRNLYLDAELGMAREGTNLIHGREAYRLFLDAGLREVRVDAVVVDTLNAPRAAWKRMFECWRDGYAAFKARCIGVTTAEVERRYAEILRAVEDPRRWVGWWLMAVSGRR